MFTNVMWATDGSEHADRGLPYAVRIAKDNGATLHAVHVIEKMVGGRMGVQLAHVDEPELDARIKRQIDENDRAEGTQTIVHMVSGEARDVPKAIAAAAADEAGIDLIVIGTRGRSALVGTVIGSVAQRLPHLASCPVLIVSPKAARDGLAGQRVPAGVSD